MAHYAVDVFAELSNVYNLEGEDSKRQAES